MHLHIAPAFRPVSVLVCGAMVVAGFSFPQAACAAAWTQAKDKAQLVAAFSGYQSTTYFDEHKDSLASSEKFTKLEFNPYLEYGLTDDITVGINPTVQQWNFTPQSGSSQDSRFDFRQCGVQSQANSVQLAEAELFVRKRIWQGDNTVFSVQPLVKTPCFLNETGNWGMEQKTMAWEIRGLIGHSFQWHLPELWEQQGEHRPYAGQYHFMNMEVAYRERPSQFSDQVKVDSTLGVRVKPEWLLLGQVFSVFATENEPVEEVGSTFREDKYGAAKVQLSGVRQMNEAVSLQMGAYSDVWGRNSGEGIGMVVSLWYGF